MSENTEIIELQTLVQTLTDKIGLLSSKDLSSKARKDIQSDIDLISSKIEEIKKINNQSRIRLMAFWRYDTFPYLLSSEVDEIRVQGKAKLKGYNGGVVSYSFILPYEDGIKLQNELDTLKNDKEEKQASINREFNTKREDLINKYIGKE